MKITHDYKNIFEAYYVLWYLIAFFLLSAFFNASLCDAIEVGSMVNPEPSPDVAELNQTLQSEVPGSPLNTEPSALTEEEKNLQLRDEYIVKIGTGVIICTIIVNVVLYYVLIYSKTN